MKRLLTLVLVGLLVLSLGIFAACSPQQGSEVDNSQGNTAETPTSPDTSTPPAEEITTDGVFIALDRSTPEGFDPQKNTGISAWQGEYNLYDTLVVLDPEGKVQPELATSWEIAPDGSTVTFHLRDDVYFHSGKKFTAADVKYTLERWMEPDSLHLERIDPVDTVEVVDDTTVVLHMKYLSPGFMQGLASAFGSIVNQESVEAAGDEYGQTVVDGTGPFKLKEFVPDDHVTYERFDKYTWGPAWYDNQGPARLKEVTWKAVPEHGTLLMTFQAGDADAIYRRVQPDDLQLFQGDDNFKFVVNNAPSVRRFWLNTRRDKLSDQQVRIAIEYGMDRQSIVDNLYAGLGGVGYSIVQPGASGYWAGIEDDKREYDPEKAQQILDEAGWVMGSDGFRQKDGVELNGIQLLCLPDYADHMTLIQENLRAIGIGIEVVPLERAAFYDKTQAGDYDIYMSNDTEDSATDLYSLFDSKFDPTPTGWYSDELDGLLETYMTSVDVDAGLQAIYDAQKIIHDQALAIGMNYPPSIAAYNATTLHDFTVNMQDDAQTGKWLDVWSTRTTE